MIQVSMRIRDKGGDRSIVTKQFTDIGEAKHFCEGFIGQDVKTDSRDEVGENICEHILLTDYTTMETVNYEQDPPMWV